MQTGRRLYRLLFSIICESVEDSPSAKSNMVQRQVAEQPMADFPKYNCKQINQACKQFKSWFIMWL